MKSFKDKITPKYKESFNGIVVKEKTPKEAKFNSLIKLYFDFPCNLSAGL